jgi:hypothetical protein
MYRRPTGAETAAIAKAAQDAIARATRSAAPVVSRPT